MTRLLTRVIRQLEALAVQQRSHVEALQAEQRSLRLDAAVVALTGRQLDALVELAEAVAAARRKRRHSEGPAATCGANGANGDVDSGLLEPAAGQEPDPDSEFWRAQIKQLSAQAGGPSGVQQGEPPAQAAALPECLAAPRLGWSPAAVAERLFSEEDAPLLTVEGCRRAMHDLVIAAAQLMPRIRQGAPDAAAALQRLVTLQRRTLELTALLAIGEGRSGCTMQSGGCSDMSGGDGDGGSSGSGGSGNATGAIGSGSCVSSGVAATGAATGSSGGGRSAASRSPAPSPLVEVVLRPLDGSDTPLPDDKFWLWAVEQMQLEPEQEEVLLLLMERWRARSQAVNQRCLTLHAEVEARAGMDAAAHDDLLSELAAAQVAFEVNTAIFILAAFGSVLRFEQVSDLMVASWPFAPSAHMLHQVLNLRSNRRKQAAAAAAMAAALPPGQGRGRRAAGSPPKARAAAAAAATRSGPSGRAEEEEETACQG